MNTKVTPLEGVEFDVLIRKRIKDFWGYGSLKSPVWFVGMEEGVGAGTPRKDFLTRFRLSENKVTIDMREGMEIYPDHMRWFKDGAPIQPTWKYPIALYLYLKNNMIPMREEVREHQIHTLADSKKKETACIELMPLPANSIKENSWVYGKLNVPNLSTRKEYIETYKPRRVAKLQKLIQQHKPKLVIFYSLTYLPDWKKVIGKEIEEVTKGMYFTQTKDTSFCVIPQSVSFGMSYKRLYAYGKKVKDKIIL